MERGNAGSCLEIWGENKSRQGGNHSWFPASQKKKGWNRSQRIQKVRPEREGGKLLKAMKRKGVHLWEKNEKKKKN